MGGRGGSVVVAVKEVASAVAKEEWSEERLLPGDIIERVTWVDGQLGVAAPFAHGKAGLENELRQMFHAGDLPVLVKVRRFGGVLEEVHANILSEEPVIPKKHYTLRSFQDFRHVVYLIDTTENECLRWQESTMKILDGIRKSRKSDMHMGTKKGLITKPRGKISESENILHKYPWMQKMQRHLPIEKSSMVFSMLFMPFQPSSERVLCNGVEDTTARAMAWFLSAQAAGVPIIFVSIQTEYIFKESSNDVRDFFDAASKGSIEQLSNCGRFKLACANNIMLDVARAVRLWYVPPAAEVPIDLFLNTEETKFGFSMAKTEEGFCYVDVVHDKSPSDRAGVKALLELATMNNKLLVVSRVGEKKVLPWLVSCDGSIHYHGVQSIREQLCAMRETQRFARIHLMVWESSTRDMANDAFMIDDTCHVKRSELTKSMELICSTPPTCTPSIFESKSSHSKQQRISWSDTIDVQLATTNEI